jgi:hypothetical protein
MEFEIVNADVTWQFTPQGEITRGAKKHSIIKRSATPPLRSPLYEEVKPYFTPTPRWVFWKRHEEIAKENSN